MFENDNLLGVMASHSLVQIFERLKVDLVSEAPYLFFQPFVRLELHSIVLIQKRFETLRNLDWLEHESHGDFELP